MNDALIDLPPAPPIGTVVADRGKELWRRESYGWMFELSPGRWDKGRGISWRDLNQFYGPIEAVPDA